MLHVNSTRIILITLFAALLIYQPSYQVTYAQENVGEMGPIISETMKQAVNIIMSGNFFSSIFNNMMYGVLDQGEERKQVITVEWDDNNNPSDTLYYLYRCAGSSCNEDFSVNDFSNPYESKACSGSDCVINDDGPNDNGLGGNQYYCYKISSLNQENEKNPSSDSGFTTENKGCKWTLANIPGIPGVTVGDSNPIHEVDWDQNGNTEETDYNLKVSYKDDSGTEQEAETFKVDDDTSGNAVGEDLEVRNEDNIDLGCKLYGSAETSACLDANRKVAYSATGISNNNNEESPSSDESDEAWTPVNYPTDVGDVTDGLKYEESSLFVEWNLNENPDYTDYVVCRADQSDSTSDSDFNCLKESTGDLQEEITEGKACTDITQEDLDFDGTGSGCLVTSDQESFTDPTTTDPGRYTYRVMGVSRGCEDSINTDTPTDDCYITQMSVDSQDVTYGGYWILDTPEDFENSKLSTTFSESSVQLHDVRVDEQGDYGNGALVLDCSENGCTGRADFTITNIDKVTDIADSVEWQNSFTSDSGTGQIEYLWSTDPTATTDSQFSSDFPSGTNSDSLKLRIKMTRQSSDDVFVRWVRVPYSS